jgi:hypothetical protein
MKNNFLKVHPDDDIIVALQYLDADEEVKVDRQTYTF